jgi:hypothetical protein
MPVRLASFDPGQTTGYCVIDIQDDGKDFSVHRCDEIPWEARFANIDYIFINDTPQIIVVEQFRLYPHKAKVQIGSIFPSVRVIGIIETMCYIHGLAESRLYFQGAGDIVKTMVLERDMTMVAGSPHKIDAYRHARLHFLRHFFLNPFEKQA